MVEPRHDRKTGDAVSSSERWTPADLELLRLRARNLAQATRTTKSDVHHERALLVVVSGERCAIPTSVVRGVARLRHWAPLPRVRPEVAGLFSWNGQILPAFQLRSVLAIPLSTLPEGTSVVVVGTTAPEAGLVVDVLQGTLEVDRAALLPVPERFSSRGRRLLVGVTPDGVPLVDGDALMSSHALFVRPPATFGEPS